jgi:hypothetical protein
MERVYPDNLESSILYPLMGFEGKKTSKKFAKLVEKHEIYLEKSLIETLGRISINAVVKTDRFSLPYNNEIVITLYGESYLSGPYEFHKVARKIVSELLEKNIYKIRFYIYMEFNTSSIFGSIDYHFRYYIQERNIKDLIETIYE